MNYKFDFKGAVLGEERSWGKGVGRRVEAREAGPWIRRVSLIWRGSKGR